MTYDVVIIGAGIAGIAAANRLRLSGLNVVILEAQNRIGGRVWTDRTTGGAIEIGAEFVHGKAASTWSLIKGYRIRTIPMTGKRWLIDERGERLSPKSELEFEQILASIRNYQGAEEPVKAFYMSLQQDRTLETLAYTTESDYEALGSDQISTRHLSQTWENLDDNTNFVIPSGYDQVVTFASEGLPIHIQEKVTQVRWGGELISVASTKCNYECKKLLVTVSLGILKRKDIDFTPALPEQKQSAIDQIGMGESVKIALLFREPIPILEGVVNSLQTVPSWWPVVGNPNVVMGLAGGDSARSIMAMDEKDSYETAVRELSKITNFDCKKAFVAGERLPWMRDNKYAGGSYSCEPVDLPDDARVRLGAPVDDKIYFAGEATALDGNYATVHGALDSGLRAANEIINQSSEPQSS